MIAEVAPAVKTPLTSTKKLTATTPPDVVELGGQKKPAAQKPVGPIATSSSVTGSSKGTSPLPSAQ